ncbi:hypothetical protein ABT010_34545 [Streptomyces sp. NPDC002668]|uniref:hypothetical protein n=1 Tax=Streptomyces sp. NPDC002668 TaxID=3154422 RepID=UPI0033296B6F
MPGVHTGFADRHFGGLGEVPKEYHHRRKLVTPGEDLGLPNAYLKWYDVHHTELAVAPEVREEARGFLRAEAAAGRLDLRNELGFVILHRSGEVFFLIVCVWRSTNEMWQTLHFKEEGGFEPYPREGILKPTQCVWELGPTAHEQQAWSRYLFSRRDEDAKRAYIEDRLTALV